MKLSGFTFLRNAVRLGYPFLESIRSALPIVDEFVVALGEGDDDTPARLSELATGEGRSKLRIINTTWNTRAPSGYVYAAQSLAALYNCTGDWALYLQGDEVLHENDHAAILASINKAAADPRVEGLYFDYLHFFGSGSTLATGPAWYRREVRIVRNTNLKIVMPSDAQYFTTIEGRKRLRYLRCIPANAQMYHYGWARSIAANERKQTEASAYYHQQPAVRPYRAIDPATVKRFEGSHPAVVRGWVDANAPGTFVPDPNYALTTKDKRQRLKISLERLLGIDLSKDHFTRM
jgi:glycosyltransferase involved in cell wall biosynthesis